MESAFISIIGALITGALSLIGVIYASKREGDNTVNEVRKQMELQDVRLQCAMEKNQAVTDTKIEELTREVREHNNFAKRMPVLEEKISVANHRIEDLEKAMQGYAEK